MDLFLCFVRGVFVTGRAGMTQVMRRITFISNVVNVGFVLHVCVHACPLSGSGHLRLTGTL